MTDTYSETALVHGEQCLQANARNTHTLKQIQLPIMKTHVVLLESTSTLHCQFVNAKYVDYIQPMECYCNP